VIVCSDLNAAPHSPVLRPLRDALVNAWLEGRGGPMAVTLPSDHPHAPLEAEELIDQRIDHIFFRPGQPGVRVRVGSVALVGDAVNGLHPSDHRGVYCDLRWTTKL
jgi:endonuclease/exonuclease/phosphatase family metal-dependent hydrolase